MNAPLHLDDIALLVGEMPATEREQREKLRGYRNAAQAMIAKTECPTARQLAWLASDYAGAVVYSAMPEDGLAEIAKFTRRLMVTAMQAEAITDILDGSDGMV